MDGIRQRLTLAVQRYKYVLLVVLAGIFLMLLPGGEREVKTIGPAEPEMEQKLDERLEQILSQIHGVGTVRVLLTVARGEETLYIYDEDGSSSPDSGSSRREAVLVTGQDRAQSGLISQVLAPVYQGAVVVCQGGDQPGIRLQVVEAVCDATGLSADKVTVLKMK